MSNRIELNEQDMENVVGGVLRWTQDGKVFPKDDPSAVYTYHDYYECQAWIIKNWNMIQDENCLKALQAAGLVKKL